MILPGEQVFPGSSHRIRFLFQPSGAPADTMCVVFADTAEEPALQFVAELSPTGLPCLFVLDDFGPYAGDAGYPGCWYLGEGRRLTVADDVCALVAHAAATTGVQPEGVIAGGVGAGGFAALHLALRCGWGRVIAGFPHTRLGRHLVGDLDVVAGFIAGGGSSGDRRWLDDLLYEALAAAPAVPHIELLAGGQGYGREVVPLLYALERRGETADVQIVHVGEDDGAASAKFAGHLTRRIAQIAGRPPEPLAINDDVAHHLSRWSRRSRARISRVPDGIRCFAPAIGKHDGGVYAGVRFECRPFGLLSIELTLRRPGELEAIIVDAVDDGGNRLARWQRSLGRQGRPGSGRMTLVLTPDIGPPFKTKVEGELRRTAAIDVFVRIGSERSGDFTVHSIETLMFPDTERPPPGLELPGPIDAAASVRRLRDDAALARHVAELAARGTFPPAIEPPERPVRRPSLKVACLLDRFSELGFRYEFDYVDFTPDDFREVIDRELPDLLLVESIWRGKDDTWDKLMVPDSSGRGPADPVRELVSHCRDRGIPTVFWNKEDPPNYEHFERTAVLFDYIFTTDESCVPRYEAAAGHDRVGVLPFAAQPAIHNPVGAPVVRPLDVAFLGTFYGRKHPDRKRQMELILDPAREFGVHIYSRVQTAAGYAFPDKYLSHLIGSVPYEQVLGAYRTYKVLLNVNSVTDSRTMCARRVFEILACGGTVVSGPSPAIEAVLGPGIVYESGAYGRTREILEHVLFNESLRERTALEGIRRVARGHTYGDRVELILDAVGMTSAAARPTVTLAAAVDGDDQAREIVEAVLSQTRKPEHLVLLAPASAIQTQAHRDAAGRAGVELVVLEGSPTDTGPALLAATLGAVTADVAGLLAADSVYGAHYMEDLVYAFQQSGADVVGKGAHYELDRDRGWIVVERRADEHRFVDNVHPDALLASRAAIERVPPSAAEDLVAWQARCNAHGLRIYAADRFNFAAHALDVAGGHARRQVLVETFGAGVQHALA